MSYAQYAISELGGADRDRTDDLRLAKPALSQLSYSPGKYLSRILYPSFLKRQVNDPITRQPRLTKPSGIAEWKEKRD